MILQISPESSALVRGAAALVLILHISGGSVGIFEKLALCVVLACAATDLSFGLLALNSPTGSLDDNPAALFFVFGSVMALSATADLKMILHGGISGAQRIARHVWRMCFA